MDAGKGIVESVYCDKITRMQESFLNLETIPEQLIVDGEGTIYAVREMG